MNIFGELISCHDALWLLTTNRDLCIVYVNERSHCKFCAVDNHFETELIFFGYTIKNMQSLFSQTIQHWRTHNAPRMGAALAYYGILSLIPLIIIFSAIAGIFFSTSVVEGTLFHELQSLVGVSSASYIYTLLGRIEFSHITTGAAVFGALVTVMGAVGVFSELMKDLDQLWEVEKKKKPTQGLLVFIRSFVRTKIIGLFFIGILVLLLFGILICSVLLSRFLGNTVSYVVFSIGQFFIQWIIGSSVFMLVYRFLPQKTISWSYIIRGAISTALLSVVGNMLIGVYIYYFVHISEFGAAASLVALLVWVYYSAQVFFFGASFTYIYAKRNGITPVRETVQL